jgi:DNA-binding beta-propeller fold protein YncE
VILVVGERGTGSGQFLHPRSVAVNGDGSFCVVDRSGRIQWFGADGGFLLCFQLPEFQRGQPTGINFAGSGQLLVADSHYQRVLAYEPLSRDQGPPAESMRFGSEGSGDGQFTLVRDIVEDSRGFLYVGDYSGPRDRIEKFGPRGEFILDWGRRGSGDGEFRRPQGLAIGRGPDGGEFILVADSCNHRVQRFTLEGTFLGSFGKLGSGPGEMKYPYGVAVTPPEAPGHQGIYVVEWGNNRLQRFDARGRPEGTWGGPGHGVGELATPWDVAIGPDGRIFVVDYGNHRVQVLNPDTLSGG